MNQFLLVVLVVFSASVFGQDLETDRPDQTESSAVVPINTIQIETGIGVEFIENSYTGAKENSVFAPTTLFRISMNKYFEFRLVNTLEHHKADLLSANESRGWHIDDLEMGTKIQLYDRPNRKTQIALMQHIAMPTSLSNSNAWGSITKLLISHELKKGFSIGYNLGYDFHQTTGQLLTYSVALSIPINQVIGAYIETYGDYWFENQPMVNVDGGFTFAIKETMQLDYSFGIGLTQLMNYQAIGLSIRLPH